MNVNTIIQLVVSILSGLVVCLPLVVKLIQYTAAAIKEKNWSPMMNLVMNLMAEAEKNYAKGSEKKEYVLNQIKGMASTLNYDIDYDVISEMIDSICSLSKELNK